ncbi:MAG: protein-L-isoaspartate O-methyltransferase [Gammaproteobacteria bacterium]|jgi:protein-L-isoaspartate(D-aspartate) O-methyltransferase|nr:protein-L-isoaspartate O-methyltransferase [Gammaproteobacteria bacterium]MDH3561687.1 protein-L-isoaspartate O-methyltransferase [Gammaproteobacteria bacterium]
MKPMDFEQARYNMIEQQVRPWDVLDQRVLDVMTTLPREAYVPQKYRSLAFADISIPLGHDQVMMAPKLEGRLLQTLAIKPDDTVLEIGTGSGYLTACLATLGQHVTSWEIFPELSEAAQATLAEQDVRNVTLEVGDATREVADEARYDVIAVTGSVPVLQQQFHHNLKPGGRLFVITGKPPIMEALLITRLDADNWAQESLFETSLPPLVNATEPQRFAL